VISATRRHYWKRYGSVLVRRRLVERTSSSRAVSDGEPRRRTHRSLDLPFRAIPLARETKDFRFGDGPDGRRQIGSNPPGVGGAGSTGASREPRSRRPDKPAGRGPRPRVHTTERAKPGAAPPARTSAFGRIAACRGRCEQLTTPKPYLSGQQSALTVARRPMRRSRPVSQSSRFRDPKRQLSAGPLDSNGGDFARWAILAKPEQLI
jgi:hypothetical protein